MPAAAAVLLLHGEQLPLVGNALEAVNAPVGELQPRARDKILHGTRDEHLAGGGHARDSLADMHGDARDVSAARLHLAGVQAGAYLQAERADGV